MNKFFSSLSLSAILFLHGGLVFAIPIKHESVVYYKISGNSVEQLRQQMNLLGPFDHDKKFDANTRQDIHWHYNYTKTNSGCKITSAEVKLDITYTFPQWVEYNQSDVSLKNKWDYYLEKIKAHELIHAGNGDNAAAEIENVLTAYPAVSTCKALELHVNARCQQVVRQSNERDILYDRNTQHGITQGVVL